MTGFDAPRGVRLASLFTLAMVPVGVLLVLDGLLELRWWSSAQAHQLLDLLAQLKTTYGLVPPALLRGHSGAVQLLLLGVAATAFGLLGLWVRRGRLWARTWALGLGAATFLFGLVCIGSDVTEPNPPATYLTLLEDSAVPQFVPQVEALLYPSWYPWAEDLIQGAQVLMTLVALARAGRRGDRARRLLRRPQAGDDAPDEWDAAMSPDPAEHHALIRSDLLRDGCGRVRGLGTGARPRKPTVTAGGPSGSRGRRARSTSNRVSARTAATTAVPASDQSRAPAGGRRARRPWGRCYDGVAGEREVAGLDPHRHPGGQHPGRGGNGPGSGRAAWIRTWSSAGTTTGCPAGAKKPPVAAAASVQ